MGHHGEGAVKGVGAADCVYGESGHHHPPEVTAVVAASTDEIPAQPNLVHKLESEHVCAIVQCRLSNGRGTETNYSVVSNLEKKCFPQIQNEELGSCDIFLRQ